MPAKSWALVGLSGNSHFKFMNSPKPYRVAEIAYDPSNPDFPWYVRRSGTIAEQGGLGWGYESLSFETIEAACEDLAQMITEDLDAIKANIEKRELSGETG